MLVREIDEHIQIKMERHTWLSWRHSSHSLNMMLHTPKDSSATSLTPINSNSSSLKIDDRDFLGLDGNEWLANASRVSTWPRRGACPCSSCINYNIAPSE